MKKKTNTREKNVYLITNQSVTSSASHFREKAAPRLFKRIGYGSLLFMGAFAFLLTACAPQAYVTLHSEPSGAHLYTKNDKFVGITPYTVKLKDVPVEAREKGVWELGELIAYKEGYNPVRRTLELPVEVNSPKKKKLFQTEITEWEFLFDFNNAEYESGSNSERDFFACNYWLDEDQNSCISRHEFRGVKDHFRMHEKVTFVALLKHGAGVNYSYALQAPDGTVYRKTYNNKTRFNNAMAQAEFYVRELVNHKGVGQWKMQWLIEGNPVAITAVNLTR